MTVAIVGIGSVGEACAHHLASVRADMNRLNLLNRTVSHLWGLVQDLEQSRAWGSPLSVSVSKPWGEDGVRAITESDIVVLALGERITGASVRAQYAESTARMLIGKNEESLLDLLSNIPMRSELPTIIVITNPIEATVTFLKEEASWPEDRIIGLGTTVETARISRFIEEESGICSRSIWTEIVGEHGPSIWPLNRDTAIARLKLAGVTDDRLDTFLDKTKSAASKIRNISEAASLQKCERVISEIQARAPSISVEVIDAMRAVLPGHLAPPATRFAIASSLNAVIDSIALDLKHILNVSRVVEFENESVALAWPCVVGRDEIRPLGVPPGIPIDKLRELTQAVRTSVTKMKNVL